MPRKDVNREDWKAVDSWMAAVLDGLEGLGLQSVKKTGERWCLIDEKVDRKPLLEGPNEKKWSPKIRKTACPCPVLLNGA